MPDTGGDELRNSEPKTDETAEGEVTDGLSGSESVAREEEDARNWGEALKSPAALTARAKRVRRHDDKKCRLRGFRDSDRLIVPSDKVNAPKLGKGPTR